jgi:adenylate kinase
MNIILIGPPGVGKGTAAKMLAKRYDIPHISTGDMFRAMFDSKTERANIAKSHIDRGELVPDDITNDMVKERLLERDASKGFLFDGYPRNIEQAKAFDDMLKAKHQTLDAIIFIHADTNLLTARIAGRRVCQSCGKVYHLMYHPPLKEGVCDQCGGTLYQREDDMEQTVKRRLDIYTEQTAPILHYYEHDPHYHVVDGSGNIESTHQQIIRIIET